MDFISEILDMIGDLAELIVTEILRRKKQGTKKLKLNNKNERSRKKQCTTK